MNWEPINNGLFSSSDGLFLIGKILVDDENEDEMYVSGTFGIYKCDNRKATNPEDVTWYKVYPDNPGEFEFVRNMDFKPGDNNTIYAAGINVLRSENNGVLGSWSSIATELTNFDLTNTPTPNAFAGEEFFYLEIMNLAVGPDNKYIYVTVLKREELPPWNWGNDHAKCVYRFDVDNEWWELASSAPHYLIHPGKHEIAVVPNSNDLELYGGGVRLFYSDDSGDTWYSRYFDAHDDYHSIEFSPFDDNILYMCTDGGIWKRNISANQSYELNNGLGVATLYFFGSSEHDPYQIFSGMQDCGLNYFKNNIWSHHVTSDGFECVIDYADNDVIYGTSYAGGNGNIHRSTNDANNPSFTGGINYKGSPSYFGAPLIIHPNDHKIIYQGRRDLMKTDDGTTTTQYDWYPVSSFEALLNNVFPDEYWYQALYGLEQCMTDNNFIYASLINAHNDAIHQYNDCVLAKTENGGGTGLNDWEILTQDPPGERYFIRDLAVSPHDPNHVWIAYSSYEAPVKVMKSTNGGDTWDEFGEGLPDLPVNCIVYEFGSDDGLYVGTDVGVYYRDNSLSQWEPFMDNLPNVVVNWLEINYTANKIRAGTFGRGTWESPISCINNPETEIVVDYDQFWDRNVKLSSNLVIKPGITLTIRGMVNCMVDTKIIIEPGGKLIVDGGTLTNGCGNLWQGIEVWGSSDEHQFADVNGNYEQGYLELINGSVIENAFNAVTLWKPDVWNSTGGIVKAYNSVFKNNRRSVEFMSYQNFDPNTGNPRRNEGYFFECDFIVNDDYIATSDFAYHISMWEVDGVKFKGCDFINSQTLNPNYGYGIFTMDAGYQVTNSCLVATKPCPDTEIIPSTFTGFYAGIKSMGSNSIRPVYVNEGLFNENGYGIKLDASEFATIINNEIYVDDNLTDDIDCGFPFGVGVDLFNCNFYAVEDNEFFESTTISGNSVGTLVNYEKDLWLDPGTFLNEIYNNEYDGLTIGNEALGYNKSRMAFDVGLEYLCNENQNNTYDFYIKDHGIKPLQGKLSEAAGNTFSQNGNNEFSDFNNQAEWPIYYFYDANESTEIPIYYSEKVNPSAAQGINDCFSNYGGGDNNQTNGLGLTSAAKNTYEQQYSTNLTDYNGTYALYESLIDGGDTEGVVIDVETSWPDEMLELRDDLLERSPHLSKEVLY